MKKHIFFIIILSLIFIPIHSQADINDDFLKLTDRNITDDKNIEQIRELIDKGVNLNVKDANGWTPLMKVAFIGRIATAKLLIEKGADVNTSDFHGNTILMHVAAMPFPEQAEIFKILVQKGADVNAKNVERWTALMQAAKGHSATIIKELINKGKMDVAKNFESIPLEMARLLIKNGADVNAKDVRGLTALIMAASEGHTETVKQLIDSEAEINAQDKYGLTPLMYAVPNKIEAMNLLVKNGADVNIRTVTGRTALINAAASGDAQSVKVLLDNKADIYIKDASGKTAAEYAGRGGFEDTLKLLNTAGAQETFDFSKKEAFVYGKVLLIEEGKNFEPYGWLEPKPAPMLFHWDTGKTLTSKDITGFFSEAFKADGSFFWKLRKGVYTVQRIQGFGNKTFVNPKVAFQVPYGADAFYLGTLKIIVTLERTLLGAKFMDKILSINVIDDFENSQGIIKDNAPEFTGKIEKNLMVHSVSLPDVKDPQTGYYKLLQLLYYLTIPLGISR